MQCCHLTWRKVQIVQARERQTHGETELRAGTESHMLGDGLLNLDANATRQLKTATAAIARSARLASPAVRTAEMPRASCAVSATPMPSRVSPTLPKRRPSDPLKSTNPMCRRAGASTLTLSATDLTVVTRFRLCVLCNQSCKSVRQQEIGYSVASRSGLVRARIEAFSPDVQRSAARPLPFLRAAVR